MSKFNYARTHTLRRIQWTQWGHIRSRNWLGWFVLASVLLMVWPSIMTFTLFAVVGARLCYVLWLWVDAMERRTAWRNRFNA